MYFSFQQLLWNEQEGAYSGGFFGLGSKMVQKFKGPLDEGQYKRTAQANLFALYGGLVPAERMQRVKEWILSHMDEIKEPMSHYYLFRMLYAMDNDESDALALNRMQSKSKISS